MLQNQVLYYTGYGLILCGGIGDIKRGFEFGKLGLQLSEKLNAKSAKAKTQFAFNCFIKHWKRHIIGKH